ncbi:hypothetical protein BV898_14582 [Hypsibius exemplaris]|uniref:Uncharacterized protein n=1 Tax=Hypsibius exemplaris TaxID=2072580 RepID=A0A9X6NG49_HYPEX|nr:hypothetical protein BV898_14582 [Hypsibius exemplaris]
MDVKPLRLQLVKHRRLLFLSSVSTVATPQVGSRRGEEPRAVRWQSECNALDNGIFLVAGSSSSSSSGWQRIQPVYCCVRGSSIRA